MVICLTSARFNMKADILRQGHINEDEEFDETDEVGEWVKQQDEESGDIIRVWVPNTKDNPATAINEAALLEPFKCVARGIIDGGVRVAGTTERFAADYEEVDFVKITFSARERIGRRDRITNIRDARGNVIWKERGQPGEPPTVYEVTGVTPILDPFGRHIESFALLKRAQRQ